MPERYREHDIKLIDCVESLDITFNRCHAEMLKGMNCRIEHNIDSNGKHNLSFVFQAADNTKRDIKYIESFFSEMEYLHILPIYRRDELVKVIRNTKPKEIKDFE